MSGIDFWSALVVHQSQIFDFDLTLHRPVFQWLLLDVITWFWFKICVRNDSLNRCRHIFDIQTLTDNIVKAFEKMYAIGDGQSCQTRSIVITFMLFTEYGVSQTIWSCRKHAVSSILFGVSIHVVQHGRNILLLNLCKRFWREGKEQAFYYALFIDSRSSGHFPNSLLSIRERLINVCGNSNAGKQWYYCRLSKDNRAILR